MKKVKFEIFRGMFTTWDALLQKAADFATAIGPENLINISQSADNSEGVITVWYWSNERR